MAKKAGNSRGGRSLQGRSDFKKRKIRKSRKRGESGKKGQQQGNDSKVFSLVGQKWIPKLAELALHNCAKFAYALGGLQFGIDVKSGGLIYRRGPLKRRLYHYVVTTVILASLLHKFWHFVTRFYEQKSPDIETFMCMSLFMIHFVGWCMSVGLVYRWQEAIQLLNTLKKFVENFDESGEISPYADVRSSIEILLIVPLMAGVGLANGFVSLLFSNLPVCLYPMSKAAGLIPDLGLHPFLWQLAFLPAELMLGMFAMFNAGFGGMFLQACVGVQKLCMGILNEMNPTTLERREKMENLYVRLQIFNNAFCVWWEWAMPAALVSLSSTVIVGLFVGLRHTELPWYLYWVYPFAGVVLLFQIFGFSYDVVCVQQDSEEIMEKLQSPASGSLQGLTLEEKRKALRRSKAMTPLPFGINGLANYSVAVPLAAWDEILDQLFFLLSL